MNCTTLRRDIACSTNGRLCLPQGTCVCDAGWTSLGDFRINEGTSCDMNITAIKVLSVIDACLASTFIFILSKDLLSRLFSRKLPGGAFTFDIKTTCQFFFLFFGATDFILAIFKVIHQESDLIGKSQLISGVNAAFCITCFFSLTIYFHIILKFLRSYTPSTPPENHTKILNRYTLLHCVSYPVLPLGSIISLAGNLSAIYNQHGHLFAKIYFIGIGSIVLAYSILFTTALGLLLKEVTNSTDNDIQRVYKRVRIAYYVGGAMIIGGSSALIIFGVWDFLLKYSPYLIILIRLVGMPLFTICFLTISSFTPARNVLPFVRVNMGLFGNIMSRPTELYTGDKRLQSATQLTKEGEV